MHTHHDGRTLPGAERTAAFGRLRMQVAFLATPTAVAAGASILDVWCSSIVAVRTARIPDRSASVRDPRCGPRRPTASQVRAALRAMGVLPIGRITMLAVRMATKGDCRGPDDSGPPRGRIPNFSAIFRAAP
jgi:hypothetical protein